MSRLTKRRRLSTSGDFEASHSPETGPEIANAGDSEDTPKDQRRTLFVRSLPPSVTTERLTELFSQSRPLKHATVVLDPQTKTSKGYGFVTFVDPEDAQAAIVELNKTNIDGRKIRVEVAEARHRDVAENEGRSQPSMKTHELKAERAKKKAEIMTGRLIVRNLPWTIKEPEDLALHFRSYGKVKQAIVPKIGPNTQAGFGIVVLRGRKNAEKAIERLNGKVIDGRPLAVDWAVDKETWEKVKTENSAPKDETQTKPTIAETDESEDSITKSNDEDPKTSQMDLDNADSAGSEEDSISGSEEDDTEAPPATTVFIRNLPFTTTDEILDAHFSHFGAVRYARIVIDPETERSKGTGFVCFFNEEDAKSCVRNAPKDTASTASTAENLKKRKDVKLSHSVLENEMKDPSGHYTIQGRVLSVSRALSKSDASRREAESSSKRALREHDKRRLYLLSEGTIPKDSKLYENLGQAEVNIREASMKQRKKVFNSNPSLHISLTRLSVRNIPRSVSSKDLKALAREAVVGFATDVKNSLRLPLSKEELRRSASEMEAAERTRKQQGKGIVKQAKIVFEGREGSKVQEKSGAGRSRGYGFIEFVSHRTALMGLRWLNGHAVKSTSGGGDERKSKRLIVEFAIENAQVVTRRTARESKKGTAGAVSGSKPKIQNDPKTGGKTGEAKSAGNKRKHADDVGKGEDKSKKVDVEAKSAEGSDEKNKMAKRNRIIAKKRGMRKSRKSG